MDGFQSSQKINEFCMQINIPKPYIAALTGYDDNMVAEKCKESGMAEFLQKPVNIEKVKEIIIKNGIQINKWLEKLL